MAKNDKKVEVKNEVRKLDGEKVDKFNTLLSQAVKDCKYGNKVNVDELKSSLSDVDWNLFKQELTQLDGSISVEILNAIDKSTTTKVSNMGRNDR
ncbi:MAG: hypothetical protein Q7R52_03035 [archaeon]|nr:hypothetical protein [archaeon]